MELWMIIVYGVIGIAVLSLILVLIKYGNTHVPAMVIQNGADPVERIRAILKDPASNSRDIDAAMNQYMQLKDLSTASEAVMHESLHILLLFLKHSQCDAKMFVRVLNHLGKKYPNYKHQFDAMGEQAIVERKHKH